MKRWWWLYFILLTVIWGNINQVLTQIYFRFHCWIAWMNTMYNGNWKKKRSENLGYDLQSVLFQPLFVLLFNLLLCHWTKTLFWMKINLHFPARVCVFPLILFWLIGKFIQTLFVSKCIFFNTYVTQRNKFWRLNSVLLLINMTIDFNRKISYTTSQINQVFTVFLSQKSIWMVIVWLSCQLQTLGYTTIYSGVLNRSRSGLMNNLL
jgi:hypothetical protein